MCTCCGILIDVFVFISEMRKERDKGKVHIPYNESMCVCVLLPEAACSIAKHLGGVEVELAVVMVIGGRVPVRVWYDYAIGQNSQSILDDWHLQSIT